MRFGKIFLFAAGMLCAVEACAAGKVRIGVSNYNISNLTVGVAQSRGFFKQEGIDAEIIRMNPNVATMALVSRAEIRSVKEVKGNTVGVGSYGSTPDIIARMVVKHHGIDPESEIKLLARAPMRRG